MPSVKPTIMIKKIIQSSAVLLLLCAPWLTPAYGNDAIYYGSGVTVYPTKHDSIQLVSEEIKITKGVGLGWGVEATLTFRNHGDKTSVQMGFPFDTYGLEPDEKETDIPDPNFKTYINGKETKVTKRKGLSKSPFEDLNYPVVYTFSVPFEKGETKSIHHTYSVHGVEWSTGEYQFQYILKTGGLWKDKIKDIKVTMILPGNSIMEITEIKPREQKKERQQGGTVLSWEFHNIKPSFNIVANFKKKAKIEAGLTNGSTRWRISSAGFQGPLAATGQPKR